ncbi:MAG TPA: UDP-2,3-diacylglucosamine diphosphatase [Ramlibacter sp.]|uniref:UDP-2,3-diacylglucosamine diphosphatase n=1 Tax=Ramlibacter sp. TaxID=1917967 RepID=UPI002C0EA323|nr:UDP-2,3-diacylglucosamine diphosphatase [Ramlibacter sp.]HVZ46830.1 UDP-2,3-diacylglucosamine diphosphatase [Ramlibacter sp.]
MPPVSVPPIEELVAPPAWRTLEFISDLHLHASEPAKFEAWRRYMAETRADAVFILGDLFEVWVGDDAASEPGFDADCAGVLQAASRLRPVFFMHGNRDFLVGEGLMQASGVTLLDDPTVLDFAGQRWLLTHGDQLCLEDTDYLKFRAEVRDPKWRQTMLAHPLVERRAMAKSLRERSAARHAAAKEVYGEVDEAAAAAWLEAADARTMIHGHTHRPREHALPGGRERIVLADWDEARDGSPGELLRLDASGARRVPIS